MFDSSYEFRYVNNFSEGEGLVSKMVHIFTFRCEKGMCYIIRVEQYAESFYAIKFYLKQHKNSKNKYRLSTNQNKATRVIKTCVNVMLYMYNKDHFASFGFIGAASSDEGVACTQRFRIYRKLFENLFSPPFFQHIALPLQSLYLIANMNISATSAKKLNDNIKLMWNDHCISSDEGYEPFPL